MRVIAFFIEIIDNLSEWTGRGISLMVLPMVFLLVWEVFMRYVLNSPTIWAHELTGFLYGSFFILGGAYALRWRAHVNVDILHSRFPLRMRAILDLLTWMLFYLFGGLLMWEGGTAAWHAVVLMEHSFSPWGVPLWPLRLTIPLAGGLLLLQGSTKTISDLYAAVTGRELIIEHFKKEPL